jgi:glycerol-1-phosphate dehydrogenase [NAD(P)+]
VRAAVNGADVQGGSAEASGSLTMPSRAIVRRMPYFYEDLVSRYRGGGSCSCGTDHSIGAKDVLVGKGVLERSAALLGGTVPSGGCAWVLSDERTEEAAGREWKRHARGIRLVSKILAGEPRPVPTIELVHELASEVRSAGPALVVGVGSGVIADLAKQVSHETGLPNWAVATAASVDAYSSATAAIRVEGYHRALPTTVSRHIACDLDVISRAPRELFFDGLGDLLAKIISHLDWRLARLMTDEHYCPVIADASLGSSRQALAAARELAADPIAAARTLTDAVLTSGFCMQALGGSRPAASAEHTIAHHWEMAGVVGNPRWDLHGVLVGAASRIVLAAYRRLLEILPSFQPDIRARLAAYDREPPWEDGIEESVRPFLSKIREEMALRRFSRDVLAERLARFDVKREEILAMARPLLDELSEAVQLLEHLDFPFDLAELGVPEDAAATAIRNVSLLRHRYSCFDLAYELGLTGHMREAALAAFRR